MAWCIERQKSWTADNPGDNFRSERKLLAVKAEEDYHHMEPVLVEKTDLWGRMPPPEVYPTDSIGNPFIYLRALVEVIREIENKVNHRLEALKRA
jgi:hypothetical protein